MARLGAGAGLALGTLILGGGGAFAGSDEPSPPPIELSEIVLDDVVPVFVPVDEGVPSPRS